MPAAKNVKTRVPVYERLALRPPQEPFKPPSLQGEEPGTSEPPHGHTPDQDHNYYFQCQCSKGCECDGCISLHKKVLNLRHELSELKSNQKVIVKGKKTDVSVVDTILKNDANVRRFTGLPSKATFNALVNHLSLSVQTGCSTGLARNEPSPLHIDAENLGIIGPLKLDH